MSGERVVMLVEVSVDEEGELSCKIDSDMAQEDAYRVLQTVAEQVNPHQSRAQEAGSFGAGRRR